MIAAIYIYRIDKFLRYMKQKLFENIGGNQFKLITESIDEVNPNAKLVREGLKKVFGAGDKRLSYKKLQGVGLGYIKSVEEAKKTAIQEARILAKEYGYKDDEDQQYFDKSDMPGETDISDPNEKREIKIAKEIIQAAKLVRSLSSKGKLMDTELHNMNMALEVIEARALELLKIHG